MFANVLTIFGFAWLLNLLLAPMVTWLSRLMPRGYAWAIGYSCVLLVLVAWAAPLATQAAVLPELLPGAIQDATQQADQFLAWMRARHIPVPVSFSRLIESGTLAQQIGPFLLEWALALLNGGGQLLLVICVAAAMAIGDSSLRDLLLALVPQRWMSGVEWVYDDVRRTYSAAIRGQLSIWSIGMVLSVGTMAAFNTPGLVLWIGPLALVRLLPYIGGALGGALTMAILLLTLPWPASLVPTALIFVGQNVVGYVIEPRVLSRALQLSPALVLFAVLAGWQVGGLPGIVFGVPAVAAVQTLIEHRVRNRQAQAEADAPDIAPAPVSGPIANDVALAAPPQPSPRLQQ
jgi:predicted PurR-regulated permease PerM